MLVTIIVFFVVLGVLVFVHELGHFSTARFFKVGVDEFGFGLPPKIFGIKKGKTEYSLNWIPLGGFCKIKGVVGGDQVGEDKKNNKADADNFINHPIWQRFCILFAGVFMNFLLCCLLFSLGYLIGIPTALDNMPKNATVKDRKVVIVDTMPDSIANKADFQAGDKILKVNDINVVDIANFKQELEKNVNSEVVIELQRNSDFLSKTITVSEILENDQKGIGVYLTETGIVKLPWYSAIYYGFRHTYYIIVAIFQALYGVVAGVFQHQNVSENFSGPIGIAVLTDQVTKMGFIYVLQFTALLSINLAIFNLLPLPALDGGRIIFLIIEKLRGKPVNQKIENIVHNIGFALLLILILLVTFKDISKFQIFDHIKNIFIN